MEQDDLRWTKYEPMGVKFRLIVANVADEYGLVSLEFGEEEIDRFIIVYKPEFVPSDEEIEKMTLKYNHKLEDDAIERILSQEQIAPTIVAEKPKKKKKVKNEQEEEAVGEVHAVGTVKRVRRDAAQAIEEIRKKKMLEKAVRDESNIDSLFFEGEEGKEEENKETKNE